jgi:hypothetical protein
VYFIGAPTPSHPKSRPEAVGRVATPYLWAGGPSTCGTTPRPAAARAGARGNSARGARAGTRTRRPPAPRRRRWSRRRAAPAHAPCGSIGEFGFKKFSRGFESSVGVSTWPLTSVGVCWWEPPPVPRAAPPRTRARPAVPPAARRTAAPRATPGTPKLKVSQLKEPKTEEHVDQHGHSHELF